MSTTLEPPAARRRPRPRAPRSRAPRLPAGDRIFRGLSRGAGVLILVIMAAIAIFLIWKAIPSLQANTANFFTTQVWFPDDDPAGLRHRRARVRHPDQTAVIAMVLAVPVGIGIALFIAHYASRRLAAAARLRHRPAGRRALDHLRHVGPPVPHAEHGGLWQWLNTYLGFIPLFSNDLGIYTPLDPHRRRRPGDHDPADHLRDHPRGLHPGARAATSRRRSPSVPPAGRWCARRSSRSAEPGMISRGDARPRPGARRDDRRRADPVGVVRRSTGTSPSPAVTPSPPTSRCGGTRPGPIGLSALVACGLVLFVITLVRQHDRAHHHRPPLRVLGGELMSGLDRARPSAVGHPAARRA